MSTTLTETSSFDASIVVPAGGDARNAASVNPAFQKLANRTRYLLDGFANGAFAQGPRYVYYPGDGLGVRIAPIPEMFFGDVALAQPIEQLFSSSGLTASVWNYLYAYNSSGSIAFEWSTTGPTVDHLYKTGDTTRHYLSSARADGSGVVIPFRRDRNKYLWRASAIGPVVIATGLTSTTYADQSLATWVPPTSRVAIVEGSVDDSSGPGGYVQFRTKGDTAWVTASVSASCFTSTSNGGGTKIFEIETDSSQRIQYRIQGSAGALFAAIGAVGYYE